MRTIAFLPAGVALIALLVSLAPLATSHDVEIAVSGDFAQRLADSIFIPLEEEADLCVISATAPFDLTGDLVGSGFATITIVTGVSCAQFGAGTFEGQGAFIGALVTPQGPAFGTFGFEIEGSFDAQGDTEFQTEIEGGIGALAGLDGELTFVGNVITGLATYSGLLELDDNDDDD